MSEETQETFLSHLIELRQRLVRALVAMGILFIPAFFFSAEIYDFLALPLVSTLPQGSKMIATGVITPFLIPMKIAAMAAFLVALPYILYEVWAFVAPGLYQHEKRLALPVIVSSVFFFAVGMSFAYFVVFPVAFGFFAGYTPPGVQMMTDIDKYLSFVLTMFIAFGLTFETPVVVVVLVRMGVISLEKLKGMRPYVIVGAFVIGAIFTPPDVISQCLLAIPLWVLFELGLFIARFVTVPVKDDAPADEKVGSQAG